MIGYIADHAIMGGTYRKAIENQIDKMNEKHGFYQHHTLTTTPSYLTR